MHQQPLIAEPWATLSPLEAAARLSARPHCAWLDSALAMPGVGRWSIVASDPRWVLRARGRELTRTAGAEVTRWRGDPIAALDGAIAGEGAFGLPAEAPALPFYGGAIGYLGFELSRQIERLPAGAIDDLHTPDLYFAWYDAALVCDGEANAGWLVGARDAVRALRERLDAPAPPHASARDDRCTAAPLRSTFTRTQYLAAVERALRYIAAGDIYQVNLAQRFSAPAPAEPFALYSRLREASPAPFAAYLAFEDLALLSSSPERLLLADGDYLETRPIKGTRPRGATPGHDARLAEELRASAKDAAEHVMIVDLERNDLGRIAEIGSVRVAEFAALERYAHVQHLTSTVAARRRAGVDLAATLRAVFPGGSVTGAPKIRALEIIDELEPRRRGVYTGAIGYISAHGRLDLNVAIRTITLRDGMAHFHAGGAIVADSDPAAEYQETLDKARGMARALGVALPDERPARRRAGSAAR